MSIGENIKAQRKLKGLTQARLAEMSNISRSYLGDLEGNRYNPSIDTLKSIAKSLNIDVSSLIGNDNIDSNLSVTGTSYSQPVILSKVAKRDIGIALDNFRDELLTMKSGNSTSTALFHGKPITDEGIDEILNSMRLGMELAEMRIALAKTNNQTQDDNKG